MIIYKPHELLSVIDRFMPAAPTIVEVGAFNGTDTVRMAEQWPQATIHAFEPVPEIFERLTAATKDIPTIHPHQYAIHSSTGTAPFFIAEKTNKPGIATQAGSLREPYKRLEHSPIHFPRTTTIATIRLADWMREQHVQYIDLLWLDTQGHEFEILASSIDVFPQIRMIYTEVGFYENYKGQRTYPEFAAWLAAHQFYEVARDFTDTTRHFFGNVLFMQKAENP